MWGWSPHSQKWEAGVLRDSWKIRAQFQGSNLLGFWAFFMSLERSWSVDVQNGLTWAIWTFAAQVMAKEGPGVKLPVSLPTTKSQESTSSQCLLTECDLALESFWGELQLWFRPRPNQRLGEKLCSSKVSGLQPGTVSGLPLGSLGKKSHLDVASAERCRVYYMGEGGGFPWVRAVVNQVCQSACGLSQHPKVFSNVD